MSAQGGNLQQPSKKVLFNSISADNIGVYFDTELNQKVLVLKEHGYSIPFISGVTQVKISHTTAWQPKVQLVKLTGNMPCQECYYDYDISIRKYVKRPGVENSDYYDHQKAYGGQIKKLDTTAATISAAQALEMKETIIKGINTDKGVKKSFAYEHPGAVVLAGQARILDTAGAGNIVLISNGVTYNGNGANAGERIAALITAINAGTMHYAYHHPTVVDSIVLIMRETQNYGNTAITLTTTTNIAAADTTVYIGLIGKYTDVSYSVVLDEFFATNFLEVQPNRFSQLSSDHVFTTFSQIPNMGCLGSMTRSNEPVDASFVKVTIINRLDHYDLHGASHANKFLAEVELFIKESEVVSATNKFLSTNYMSTAGGYDKDFNELTEEWNGTATGWADVVSDLPY